MSAADRVTAFKGCPNFRHMGGYRVRAGGVTRADRLFRSGRLDLDAPDTAARFAALGVRQVFDFRQAAEAERHPVRLPEAAPAAVASLPITAGNMSAYLDSLATTDRTSLDTRAEMTRMYAGMLDAGAPSFRRFLAEAAEADGPVMIMCTLGKDRTGVACALLLTALGVAWHDVVADYLLTAETLRGYDEVFYAQGNFTARGIALEPIRDMLTAHPEYLEAMRATAEATSGSLDAYLAEHLGVTEDHRQALRARYTTA
jgi:protein-tyrosine phosphatase